MYCRKFEGSLIRMILLINVNISIELMNRFILTQGAKQDDRKWGNVFFCVENYIKNWKWKIYILDWNRRTKSSITGCNHGCKGRRWNWSKHGLSKEIFCFRGMGSAMLSDLPRTCNVVKILYRNLNIPVLCKVQMLENEAKAVEFIQGLVNAGANVSTIHSCIVGDERINRARF